MIENFPFYLSLIIAIVLLIMLANKIKVAYSVLLFVAGLLISFIQNIPMIRIDPELIFIIFLPPLLYEAAWAISWKELWKWRRIIGNFAFIVVFLTTTTVAFVANHFIPGFGYGLLITLVLIVVRILSAYGAVFVTLIARNFIAVADTRHPGYKIPALFGWTGMSGMVSLTAALSIPMKLYEGGPDFPQRNLVLFITFIVILTTLLV